MEGRRRAAALVVAAGGGGGEVAGRRSCCCCNLCGDVGFREALLPCGARGCFRFQHTYCGRYCPEVVDDVERWRCEWCAREEGRSNDRVGEEEDSRRKRSRRAPPSLYFLPDMKQASPESERSSSADRERRATCHKEDQKESTVPGVRAQAPRSTGPGDSTTASVETDSLVVPEDSRPSATTNGGGGNRALDRWKKLAKRTRLCGKKYKLLTDVLC